MRRLRQRFEKANVPPGVKHVCVALMSTNCCASLMRRCGAGSRTGFDEEIERELRADAEVAISRASSLFLVLLRTAVPRLDPKRRANGPVLSNSRITTKYTLSG
jgi:hypothetical protein